MVLEGSVMTVLLPQTTNLHDAAAKENSVNSAINSLKRNILQVIGKWLRVAFLTINAADEAGCYAAQPGGLMAERSLSQQNFSRLGIQFIYSINTHPHEIMRRVSRLERSVDLNALSRSGPASYLCSACRHRAFNTSSPLPAGAKVPFTEKVRQRIWGTENPPGLKDPYGNESIFDQANKASGTPKRRSRAKKVDDADYVPAETWDGLEFVGGFGGWWKKHWDPHFVFTGFAKRKVTDGYEATACVHRAVVEAFTLKEAGRDLDEMYNAGWRDHTAKVQILPVDGGATLQWGESSKEALLESFEGTETDVKVAPTESEADVAADRSNVDPLAKDKAAAKDETAVKAAPTASEAGVAADRSDVDPLAEAKSAAETLKHQELVATWDPSWVQVSLADPTIKFAVSVMMYSSLTPTNTTSRSSSVRCSSQVFAFPTVTFRTFKAYKDFLVVF
jgi:hypothetical protein